LIGLALAAATILPVIFMPVIFMPSFSDGGLWYQADLRRWRRRRDRNGKRRRRGSRP
jgi:hypothetical protein